jgi:nucleotide-binding universal stress UspA family protein
VLVLHEPEAELRTPRFASRSEQPQVVIAPTDLPASSTGAIGVAIDLARALPIELHLLHLLPNGRLNRARTSAVEDASGQLRALVPEDLRDRIKLDVQYAEHRDECHEIASIADRLSAACIVMGEQTKPSLRRWFGRDTTTALMRGAHCPVWYVPAAVAV